MEVYITIHEKIQDEAVEWMKDIIHRVTEAVSKTYGLGEKEELSVLLCDDERMHELNLAYRGIDRTTDVLSFALNEDLEEAEEVYAENLEEEAHLLGDLIISIDKMREQAQEYGHSEERELAYLTVHGCLHILGYDHMTEQDKQEMRIEEEDILKALGYLREGQIYND